MNIQSKSFPLLKSEISNKRNVFTELNSTPKTKWNNHNIILSIFLAASYVIFHNYINLFFEDDSWTLSNAYSFINHGINNDVIFLDQDGTFTGQLFGKIYFLMSGTFLNLFGWTKSNIFVFNSFLILLTAGTWYFILEHLPFSNRVRTMVPLAIPLFPPFFFAAHTGRTDALTILLISVGLLLFIRKNYVLAGLVAMFAIETHLMGAIALFYYLAYFLYDRVEFRKLYNPRSVKRIIKNSTPLFLQTTAGIVLGIGCYFLMHYDSFVFSELSTIVKSKMDMFSPVNNYILSYFFDFDWIHHIPEFVLLVATVLIYTKNKLYKENKFLFILLVVLIISTFITRRENRNYFIYIAPAVLMLYFYTFEAIRKNKTLLMSFLLVCGTYLGSLYYKHHDFQFANFISFVQDNTKESNIPIVGAPDVWFAAYDKEYYPIHNSRDFNKITLDEFYFVETDYLSKRIRVYDDVKDNIYANHNCTKIAEWQTFDNNSAAICKCISNGQDKIPITHKPYPGWQNVMKQYMPEFLVTIN